MKSVDLRRTLELLAVDESASPTEREHARRLLDRMYSDLEITPDDDEVGEESVEFTGNDWVIGQKAARVSTGISGLPVVLYHDDSGYLLIGDRNAVSAVAQTISDIQSTERDEWDDRMRVAWMAQCMLLMYSDMPNTLVAGRDAMERIHGYLREHGLSDAPVHPRVSKDYKRHEAKALRIADTHYFT